MKSNKTLFYSESLLVLFSLQVILSCQVSEEPLNPIVMESLAEVTEVTITGEEYEYSFSVTIKSPDTGCDQYADWWEVFTENGTLVYRRILGHSHVNEQPFTRSGGKIEIAKDQKVFVRAHMNNLGYGTRIFSGTVAGGLFASDLDVGFAMELSTTAPLPENCAF